MKKKSEQSQVSFTSFLPLVKKRRFLLLFARNKDRRVAWLSGYNHISIVELLRDDYCVVIEPHFFGASVYVTKSFELKELRGVTALELEVHNTRTNKLIRPLLQTCATLVQYIAGIDLGIFLVQTLYNYLTQTDPIMLQAKGIHKVKIWET